MVPVSRWHEACLCSLSTPAFLLQRHGCDSNGEPPRHKAALGTEMHLELIACVQVNFDGNDTLTALSRLKPRLGRKRNVQSLARRQEAHEEACSEGRHWDGSHGSHLRRSSSGSLVWGSSLLADQPPVLSARCEPAIRDGHARFGAVTSAAAGTDWNLLQHQVGGILFMHACPQMREDLACNDERFPNETMR